MTEVIQKGRKKSSRTAIKKCCGIYLTAYNIERHISHRAVTYTYKLSSRFEGPVRVGTVLGT